MKKQQGFGFLHILLIVVVTVGAAAVWKYQQRKVTVTAKQQAVETVSEQQLLADINLKIEDSHRQDIEIQRRVYASLNKEPPTPDQSDVTSKSLPQLEWKAMSIGMTKADIGAFSKAAMEFVSKSLKDPDSAKFSEIKVFKASHSDGGYTFICGKVNAKNSFGGYTGFQNFIVYRNESITLEGGVGSSGSLGAVRSDGKWWSYDGDDMCAVHGFSVAG